MINFKPTEEKDDDVKKLLGERAHRLKTREVERERWTERGRERVEGRGESAQS